jgi:hypothetical protein
MELHVFFFLKEITFTVLEEKRQHHAAMGSWELPHFLGTSHVTAYGFFQVVFKNVKCYPSAVIQSETMINYFFKYESSVQMQTGLKLFPIM